MADVTYPSNAELQEIAQDFMPRLMADRPTFGFFPIVNQDAYMLIWEQMDNFIGLQFARGLNGEPTRVKKTGAKRYVMQPGVYGEYEYIDEMELTLRRQYGSFNAPVNIDDLVVTATMKLKQRELDRIEAIIWTLLATGTFSVVGPTGATLHTDSFTETTFSSGVTWATSATATPLGDLRSVQLLARGKSVDFSAGAEVWMNQTTFNQFISNSNSADLFGRRQAGLSLINNITDANALLSGENLPSIRIYDKGYFDETNTFQLFIPNNKAVVIGRRPAGQTVGQYRMVRNANNPGLAPGAYTKIVDNGDNDVPRNIVVHEGHNGGPVLFYGTAIVVMTV
jgi:hypothetical protein